MPKSRPALLLPRRRLLTGAAALAAFAALPAPARALVPTPRQTAGPFYPTELPAEHDWDLVRVTGRAAQAMGQVIHLSGRVLAADGTPLAGALVEVWQCDANGIYHHPADRQQGRDGNFQGYGRTLTDADGRYRFRTIRPVAYSGRTPHVHFAVAAPGRSRLVTQMYLEGEPGNGRDFIFTRLSQEQRAAVSVRLEPADGIEVDSLAGRFDIVLV